jgi:hypothetical protein
VEAEEEKGVSDMSGGGCSAVAPVYVTTIWSIVAAVELVVRDPRVSSFAGIASRASAEAVETSNDTSLGQTGYITS